MSRVTLKHAYRAKFAASNLLDGISDYEQFEQKLEQAFPLLEDGREKGYFFEAFMEAVLNLEYKEVIPDNNLAEDGRDGFVLLNGQNVPYQVKYRGYDSRSDLTWDELSTFLAIEGINNALVVTNLDGLNHKCLKNIGSRKIAVFGRNQLQRLTSEDFDSIRAMFAAQEIVQKLHEPMPHQMEAIQAARNNILGGKSRGRFNMYCATGKTSTFSWILKDNNSNKSVLFFPNIELLGQTYYSMRNDSLGREYMNNSACLFVCSKKDVARDKDGEVSDYSNIIVTTEPSEISKFFTDNQGKRIFVFATYHSSDTLARNCNGETFDFGIFDEAHNTVGTDDKCYSYCLHSKNINIKTRLFFTATEKVIIPNKKTNDRILYSMDDAAIYGDSWYILSQKEAVDRKIIAPVKTIVAFIKSESFDRNKLKQSITNFDATAYKSSSLAFLETYKNAREKYGFTHSLSFSPTIQHSEGIEQILKNYFGGETFAGHIDSHTKISKRSELTKSFIAAKHGVITNVKIYSEGKDSPKCDSVIMLGKSRSVSAIKQRIGRAQRLNGDLNKVAYVIVPIFVEEGECEKDAFAAQGFGVLWQVLESSVIDSQEVMDVVQQIAAMNQAERKTLGRNLVTKMLDAANIVIEDGIDYETLVDGIADRVCSFGFVQWRKWELFLEFVRGLGLKGHKEWVKWAKSGLRPMDIPSSPKTVYPEWTNWPDVLDNGNSPIRDSSNFLSLDAAIKYCSDNGLKTVKQYKNAVKQANFLPATPAKFYNVKWSTLFTKRPLPKITKTFEEHKTLAEELGIKSLNQWEKAHKQGLIPEGFSANMRNSFKGRNYELFGNKANRDVSKTFMTHDEARDLIISLGVKNKNQFHVWSKSNQRPFNLPSNPNKVYKNKGWISWPHFLGTVS